MGLKDTLRVMVVDDMSVSRGLLTQALEQNGIWNVTTENNGQDALAKLAANPVHLVISDYNMPVMDGLHLLKALRENVTTRMIGFILVTGTPTPEVLKAAQHYGANNLIKKPFTPASLKQCIEQVVGRL